MKLSYQVGVLNAIVLTSLGAGACLRAADDAGVVFNGFVDTTYNYNFNKAPTNLGYSFDNQANSFALNNAQLAVSGHPKGDPNVSYVFKLDYGTDAKILNLADPNLHDTVDTIASALEVHEAYGTWMDPGTKLGIKVGKWATYEGIEVIESISDPTITRGYLFSWAEPFTQTGAVITFVPNAEWDFALGVINGWDLVAEGTDTTGNGSVGNQSKTVVAKATYNKGDPLLLTVSAYYGPEQTDDNVDNRFSLDVTGLTKVIKNIDLNFQANYGQEKAAALNGGKARWVGAAVQPVFHVNEKFSVGARVEWFHDINGARFGFNNGNETAMINVSVAPAYQVTSHLLVRGEVRVDTASTKEFEDKSGNVTKKNQVVGALESIFSF